MKPIRDHFLESHSKAIDHLDAARARALATSLSPGETPRHRRPLLAAWVALAAVWVMLAFAEVSIERSCPRPNSPPASAENWLAQRTEFYAALNESAELP